MVRDFLMYIDWWVDKVDAVLFVDHKLCVDQGCYFLSGFFLISFVFTVFPYRLNILREH